MGQPILSVANLSVSFRTDAGWQKVVHDISFDLAAKETVALVGESGSGKSVTALSVMGLNAAGSSRVEGSIRLDGNELLTMSERALRKVRGNQVAMIFQEPMTSLNPVHTIGAQVAEALTWHRDLSAGEVHAETLRLLERVRIPAVKSRLNDYPHQFSGGMIQRVMIAMALACRPKLLIADEPTTALDVTIQAQILELIKELQDEEDMSVLFITHDMGVVAEIADRTVVMYGGRVVEADATENIFNRASHPYTRALLSAVPRLGSMKGIARLRHSPAVDRTTRLSGPVTETAEQPLLEVSGLTTRFEARSGLLGRVSARVHAVENVSFRLHGGETLALVGESGCGKSTTGRSVLRLVEPLAGSVRLNGTEILKLPAAELRKQRRHMQMIFQDPFASLNPRMTVGASIAQPLTVNGLADRSETADRVGHLLKRVGLQPEMAGRFPHEFSGGQRQRVCIARALAREPRLIVPDEAVSALDVSVKAQVVNLMLELQEQMGLGYLFISHDMAVVERVSHRVAVMYLGEIVEIGPRSEIFGNPQHPYTRRLLEAVPVPDPARRLRKRVLPDDEIRSPIRLPDYVPPVRQYREVSPGHSVIVDG